MYIQHIFSIFIFEILLKDKQVTLHCVQHSLMMEKWEVFRLFKYSRAKLLPLLHYLR